MRVKMLAWILALAPVAVLGGGGFWIEFGNGAPKDKAFAVRAMGCAEPAKAVFAGTAEGMIGKDRKSIPLRIQYAGKSGLWWVERTWPQEGSWVIHLRANSGGMETHALAALRGDGSVRRLGAVRRGSVSREEIETALREPK